MMNNDISEKFISLNIISLGILFKDCKDTDLTLENL